MVSNHKEQTEGCLDLSAAHSGHTMDSRVAWMEVLE